MGAGLTGRSATAIGLADEPTAGRRPVAEALPLGLSALLATDAHAQELPEISPESSGILAELQDLSATYEDRARRRADPRRIEPLLLATMAAAGALMTWTTSAGLQGWALCAVLGGLALTAVLPISAARLGTIAITARALVVLALASSAALNGTITNAMALAWVLAAIAIYPTLLPLHEGMVLTGCAIAALFVPAAVRIFQGDLTLASDPTQVATMVSAAVVAAGLGASAAITRRTMSALNHLAEQRRSLAHTAQRELAKAQSADHTTGLPNRASLLRGVTRAMARCGSVGGQVALIVLEIDRFTTVVDTIGETGGAGVLKHLAKRLRAALSAEDLVAHIGPRTFAVLIEGVGPEGCTGIARRLITLIEEPIRASGRTVAVSASIGMAQTDDSMKAPEELMRAAETALTLAQRGGRARWATFSPAMRLQSLTRGELEVELREAVLEGEVGSTFQPILALLSQGSTQNSTQSSTQSSADDADTDDVIIGLEIAPHWNRPDGAVVPAHQILAVAQEIGLGRQLGLLILDQGLDAFAAWRRQGLTAERLHVDLPQALLDDPGFAAAVKDRLVATGVQARQVVFEISASDYLETDQAPVTLAQLNSLGCPLAMDGFGRDGLSLTALKSMPIGLVKLHRQVTADLTGDATIVQGIVDVCKKLDVSVIADGLESAAQLAAARALGVHAGQGSFIARPSAARDVPLQILP